MRQINRLVLVVSLLLFAGCAIPPKPVIGTVQPKFAVLLTSGVEITSDDGSFDIVGGVGNVTPKKVCAGTGLASWSANTMLDRYEDFRKLGGIDVRVKVPGSGKPLYGYICFFKVFANGDTAAKRVWRISVPADKIQAARGGLMSAVYQPYDFQTTYFSKRSNRWLFKKAWQASWVLFMSDAPLN